MNTANFYQNLKKNCLLLLVLGFFNLHGQDKIEPYDILISEFMPDPSPRVGLPESEYIELYNRTSKTFDLKGCKLVNGSVSTELPHFVLKSKQVVIIYGEKRGIYFGLYGDTLPLPKWVSISNPGDTFYLKSAENSVIDAAFFDLSFYQNSKKSDGGWSLERLNMDAPCLLQNWVASNDLKGGTPSKLNSVQKLNNVQKLNTVQDSPQILGFYLKDDNTIVVKFDRAMDRQTATVTPQYFIDNGLKINSLIKIIDPLFDKIELSFNTPFKKNETYHLVVKNTLKDCQMTPLPKNDTLVFQLPEKPQKQDVLINEVLFNPEVGGSRFIELYNKSTKVIEIADLKIADFKLGNVKEVKPISSNFLLFPKHYVVLTENPLYIQKRYNVEKYRKDIVKNRLPTWGDKEGTVAIYNIEGNKEVMLDSFTYNKNFHNPLLPNTEGVSLERIALEKPTNEVSNWQSAAASAGFATPAYQNSQFLPPSVLKENNAFFSIETPSFSPDGDGFEDTFILNYKMDKDGYNGSFFILDINGKRIKALKINELLSLEGQVKWTGEDDKNLPALSGTYIFYANFISPEGGIKKWKKAFALTNKL
jgi:Lamin Tail Domain